LGRANRLILLIGILLAVVVFIAIVYLLGQNGGPSGPEATPTEQPTVFATVEIELGTKVTADMVETVDYPIDQRDATAFVDTSLVIGEIARQDIVAGAQLTSADFSSGGVQTTITVPPEQRAIAVQVDQITGVGTLIKNGDYVDMVVAIPPEQFPVISINPEDESVTVVTGLNNSSVKLILEGMQVLGTLLPPPPTDDATTGDEGTALTGQQEIVILSATAQQTEIIKFAQQTSSISLVLRSVDDFRDPETGEELIPPPAGTSGIILKTLVDEYGVLVPELIEAIVPSIVEVEPTAAPSPPPGG
jgi:pilus assembly protein CpaB